MSRRLFDEMVRELPSEVVDELQLTADAEQLMAGIFGDEK